MKGVLLLIILVGVCVTTAAQQPQPLTTATAPPAPPQQRRTARNVLLLISDDQGRDAVGCYGNPIIKTPNQDRLAAEGVRFTNAFATVASCSPSRAVILTGMHQHQNGQYGLAHAVHNQHSFQNVKALPRLLAAGGYRTAIIGKAHVEPIENYGFQQRLPGAAGNRDVRQMAARAREIFASEDARPFFLVLGYSDPHRAGGGFANERSYEGVGRVAYRPEDVRVPAYLPDMPEVRRELAEYYEAVSRLDHGIGLVMKALAETGQLDHTLVIYLSDNGIPFPGAKTNLYDAGIRLPLIVRAPDQERRGVVNRAMVSWIDITPTVLEWAGLPAPAGVTAAGRSLVPLFAEEDAPGRDEIYGSHTMHEVTMYYPMRAVRTRQYKLIWNLAHQLPFPHAEDLWSSLTWQGILKRGDGKMGRRSVQAFLHRPQWELYDIERDPEEITNLAAQPAYKTVLTDLRARLHRLMRETKDPWLSTLRDGEGER